MQRFGSLEVAMRQNDLAFEVKDYSQIFPGHGGVLDRFDSIIFNSMILGFLLTLL